MGLDPKTRGLLVGFLRKIFGGKERREELEEELPEPGDYFSGEPAAVNLEKAIAIKPMVLHSAEDIELVLNEINNGNIVLLKYDDLIFENKERVRSVIERLKERILEAGGDLVLIKYDRAPPILIVPRFVEIWRRPEK